MTDAAPLLISPEAAAKLRSDADFSRSVLSIRHVLGCGGEGFRIAVEGDTGEDGHRFQAAGIPVVMDDYAFHRLAGAVLELDSDPAGEGYRLNHPDAVIATFC